MANIWITSDLHLFHNQEFLYGPRGFTNIYDMSAAIFRNWNAVVQPEDDVYCLGDMMLNDCDAGIRLIKQLKGNIHLVLGNHDTDTKIEMFNNCYNIVEIEYGARLKYGKYRFYLSHYPTLTSNVNDGKTLKTSLINLCGHTHTKDPFIDWNKGRIFHCEMDTNDCKPWLIDDIIAKLKEKDSE